MIPFSTMLTFMACGATMLLMLVVILLSLFLPGIGGWNRRYFTSAFLLLGLSVACSIADLMVQGRPGLVPLERVVVNAEYVLFSAEYPMITLFIS